MAKSQQSAGESSVKKSVSFSETVFGWAEDLAKKKGYGTNFSAYIQDLIRRDRDRERELDLAESLSADALEEILKKKKG